MRRTPQSELRSDGLIGTTAMEAVTSAGVRRIPPPAEAAAAPRLCGSHRLDTAWRQWRRTVRARRRMMRRLAEKTAALSASESAAPRAGRGAGAGGGAV